MLALSLHGRTWRCCFSKARERSRCSCGWGLCARPWAPSPHRPLLSTARRPPLRHCHVPRRHAPPRAGMAVPAAGGGEGGEGGGAAAPALGGSSSSGSSSSSSGGGSNSSSSSIGDRSGLSQAQLQAVAERLMLLSRGSLKQTVKPRKRDASMVERMVLLLRMGFSQSVIQKAIQRDGGGPYIAEQHVGEAVARLRRWGFTQKQLDALLAASNVFSRAPADLEDVLLWLQRQFGLQPSGVAKACSISPKMLHYKKATLEANWRAFEAAFRPTAAAMTALAATTQRRGGGGCFLVLAPETVRCSSFSGCMARQRVRANCIELPGMHRHAERRLKVGRLQRMLGLSDAEVSNKVGHLAYLFDLDSDTLEANFQALQVLTGGQG